MSRTGTIDNLDPVTVSAVFAFAAQPVYDPLIWERENQALEPGLAKSWVLDEKNLTVTLELQSGVQFSDGAPFNAEAVRANFERAKRVEASPYKATLYDRIDEVKVVDDDTAVIHLSQVVPDVLLQLARAPGWMISPKALESPDLSANPVGTGPYVLNKSESIPGSRYVYDVNPNHWNPAWQRVERVEMRLLESRDAVMGAALAGEVQLIDTVEGADAKALGDSGLDVVDGPPISSWFLWNIDHSGTKVPAMGDVRVRQAMAEAIDVDGFVKGVLRGDAKASNQLAWPELWAHDAALDDVYDYDPDHARQLLKEAGHADGFKCQGYIIQGHSQGTWQEGAAQMLSDVGISMDLRPIDLASYFTAARSGDYTCLATNAVWRDPAEFFDSYLSVPALNKVFGEIDKDMTELAAAGAGTFDQEARAKAYRQMFTLMVERAYVVPMYQTRARIAHAPAVDGVALTGTFAQPWDPRGVTVGS